MRPHAGHTSRIYEQDKIRRWRFQGVCVSTFTVEILKIYSIIIHTSTRSIFPPKLFSLPGCIRTDVYIYCRSPRVAFSRQFLGWDIMYLVPCISQSSRNAGRGRVKGYIDFPAILWRAHIFNTRVAEREGQVEEADGWPLMLRKSNGHRVGHCREQYRCVCSSH